MSIHCQQRLAHIWHVSVIYRPTPYFIHCVHVQRSIENDLFRIAYLVTPRRGEQHTYLCIVAAVCLRL